MNNTFFLYLLNVLKLGVCVAMKTRIDFVKLSFIQMKIYDDIACSMN
jgi:hypothetical protein